VFLPDLVIRSRQVVTPRGIRPASVHIRNGKVNGVIDFDDVPEGCPLEDAGDLAILPGMVDTQVRVCPPDLRDRDGYEGALEAATRAAAIGGVTTIVDMPIGALATDTVSSLDLKRRVGARCSVDVGFWGSVVPGNARDLAPLFEAGVLGFACDLEQWGPRSGAVSEADLRLAMPVLTRLGATLLAGAGLARPRGGPDDGRSASGPARRRWFEHLAWMPHRSRAQRYATYLESRPKAAENEAVDLMVRLCRASGTRTHIASVTSSDVLTPLFRARAERLPITAATCPHYLYFVAEEVPDGAAAFLCNPPIRDRANRELLWAALENGLIQMVASDHAAVQPCLPSARSSRAVAPGPRLAGWGISSLELNLTVTWTVARARGRSLEHLAEWMCRAPAELVGLTRKGKIDVGYDADLVVFDPNAELVLAAQSLQPGHGSSPYVGRRLQGVVERTYLRGTAVYCRGTDGARHAHASKETSRSRAPLEAVGRLLVRRAT
jgi:allantoinase